MWYTAFILGLLGSFHCVGMCGPIALMLPLDRKNPTKKFFQLMSYHLGRFSSYTIIGGVFGLLGTGFFISGYQQQLSIIAGCIMIATVIIPSKLLQKFALGKPIYKLISSVKNKLGKQFKKKSFKALFSIGFFNGLLPCGLVYLAVFGALALGNPAYGALYMFFFGLGTLPLMSIAAYLGNFISSGVKTKVQKLIPVFIVVVGALFILRGMGLGIKYISPSNMSLIVKAEANCH